MSQDGSEEPSGSPTADSATLFDEYRARIHGYVLRLMRDSAEADDLTQETFLRAHRKLASLKNTATLSAWLYRIATNVCYDRFRQASYRRPPQPQETTSDSDEGEAPQVDVDAPRLDLVIEQGEMSQCVQEYLEQLPDDYRMVILLHDLNGMTNPQIAEALGCSLATAKIRLHRAREKLKAALVGACDFSCDERGVIVCDRKLPDD